MFRRSIIFFGITAAALADGCGPKPVASSPARPAPAVETPAYPAAAAPIDAVKQAPAADQRSSAPATPKSTAIVAAVKDVETPKSPTAEAHSTLAVAGATKNIDATPEKNHGVRLAVLTPGGPLLIDVNLTIDGHPLTEAFDKLIDDVLAAADTDKDSHATWKELAANEEYLKKQPGGNPVRSRDLKMWTEQWDRNHDGEIQRDEAAAWLGRNSGRRAQVFSLRSSRSYFSVPSASSRIWKMLDVNDDEQLSAEELARCTKTLLAFDDDDDGAVSADEFQSLREQLQVDAGSAARVERTGNPFAALYLEPDFKADRLEYLLTDLYAPQQALGPESFPSLVAPYKKLDANGDGRLDVDELAAMLTTKPHIVLSIDFPAETEQNAGKVSLQVSEHIPEVDVLNQPAADRAVLTLGSTRLVIMATDLAKSLPPAQSFAANEVRLMVHDQCDALCELLDADADGRLGEREISTAAATLLKYDADRDGQLQSTELPYTMIVAFQRGERPDDTSFYRPRSNGARSALANAPAWFIRADFNGDGDVSRREFLGTDAQFSQLDTNHDGFISAAEAAAAAK